METVPKPSVQPKQTAIRTKRLDRLLTLFDTKFPTALFAELFGISEWQVRQRRRGLGRMATAVRIDRFARTSELPSLKRLDAAEQTAVKAYWEDLRKNYARTERVRRMREVVRECSDRLPVTAIGMLFEVSGGAVRQHQIDFGVQLKKARADQLLREFLRAEAPPQIEMLDAVERFQLTGIWQKMRDDSGRTKRAREDVILRGLNDRLPSVYFAEKFGIETASVAARRKELGLECAKERSEALLRAFLRWKELPTLPVLTAVETVELREIWQRVCARYRERKRDRQQQRERELIASLKAKKKKFKGSEPQLKCGHPKCKFVWPRTADFFDRNCRQPDGLEQRCKVCESRRRVAPKLRRRAKPRIIKGAERERAREIVKANAAIIPARLLKDLLQINGNHLMYIREEAKVEVSTQDSWYLYVNWMIADEMPQVVGLNDGERERLHEIWRLARESYQRSRTEDDGKLNLQREDRRQLLEKDATLPLVACAGPYCREEGLTWPRTSQFFRRYGRCKPEDRRCHACANRDRREQVMQNRRANGGKVK